MKRKKHKKEKGVADYFSCAYCLDRYGSCGGISISHKVI